MGDFILPSSPNWFLPSISSGNDAGLYAFGSRTDVFVYDISSVTVTLPRKHSRETQSEKSQPPQLIAFYAEHSNKLTSVCLSPDPNQWICCSCQEDLIKLWDVRSLVTIQETDQSESKSKFTSMSWSTADTDLVFTSTDKGTVLLWKLKTNTTSSFECSKENIFCIASSPHSASIAALGYRGGLAAIVSFDLETERAVVLHRLRGHDADIYCVCWCPVRGEDPSSLEHTTGGEGALVATVGRRFLKVWSSSRGKEVFQMKLSQGARPTAHRDDPFNKKTWVDIVWSKLIPAQIVITGNQGDLLYISAGDGGSAEPRSFSHSTINKHARMIFNVVEAAGKLCTFSLDRTIAIWDNKTKTGLVSCSSFAGHVFCARASPLDPGRIAIGAGDNNIRIWNQNNKSNPGDIMHLYNGIRSKITHVAWHPEKEGILAYGTEDGRVGVYNTLSSKSPQLSATCHKNTVYVVCWAPVLKAEGGGPLQLEVYSVGDGSILQHFMDQPKREAVNVIEAIDEVNGKPDKRVVNSELSWRNDSTAFAIGTAHGAVLVYSFPALRLLCHVEVQTKLVNCVRWHPDGTAQSPGGSPCRGLVAFAGNMGSISLLDLGGLFADTSAAIDPGGAGTTRPLHLTQEQGHLPGNGLRITDMCWSPHQDGLLVSVGYSGAAIVWNARTTEQLACYKHEMGRVLTAVWSHLDPNIIMTGGTDSTFRKWRLSAQPRSIDELARKKRKKKVRVPTSALLEEGTPPDDSAATSEIRELQELLRFKERQLLAQMKAGEGPLDAHMDSQSHKTSPPKSVHSHAADPRPTRHGVPSNGEVSTASSSSSSAPADVDQRSARSDTASCGFLSFDSASSPSSSLSSSSSPFFSLPSSSSSSAASVARSKLATSSGSSGALPHQQQQHQQQQHQQQQQQRPSSGTASESSAAASAAAAPPATNGKTRRDTDGVLGAPGDNSDDDDDEDEDDADDCEDGLKIPSAEELVPPVKPLFPRKPAAKPGLVSDARGGKAGKPRTKPRSLFPVSGAANNRARCLLHEDILDLTRVVAGHDPTDIIDRKPHLGIYTDRLGAHRCLLQESARQLGDGKMDYHLHLEMWRGNVAGAVQLAMQRNELSDWIVAMAPLASRETWEKVSGAYADQLEEDGQYYKAASYLLASHRVVDAIELFQRHGLYREAVSLAKVRLSPIDPMLEALYLEWGTQLMKDGQFEQSAKCYLAMKQVQEAGRVVARRHDLSSLKTACHMNLMVQEQEQAYTYAHKALGQFLLAARWRDAQAFLQEHDGLKIFLPVVYTHELLFQQLSRLCPDLTLTQKPVTPDSYVQGAASSQCLPEFMLDRQDTDPVVPWEPLLLTGGDGGASAGAHDGSSGEGPGGGPSPAHTFPHHLLRVWHQKLDVAMVTTDLKTTRVAIDRLTKIRPSVMDLPNLLVIVSIDVTSCLLALLASETSSAINHLLQAMAAIQASTSVGSNPSNKLLLPALCRLMLSQGPKYLLKLQQEFKASRVLLTMESDGDLDHAGGEGHNSIKRFLTDLKDDDAISTSSNWCRELDCLRAYYYLAVLDYLREEAGQGGAKSPSSVGGAASVGGVSAQENDSLDGEPTSDGSSSGLASPFSARKRGPVVSASAEDAKEVSGEGVAGRDEDTPPPLPEDCDQNGKACISHGGEGEEAKKSLGAKVSAAPTEVPTKRDCDTTCDDSRNPALGSSHTDSRAKSQAEASDSSSVDPPQPPVPSASPTASQAKSSPDKSSNPDIGAGAGPRSRHMSTTSLSLSSGGQGQQKSPKNPTPTLSPKSTQTASLSSSPAQGQQQQAPRKPTPTLSPKSASSYHSSASHHSQVSTPPSGQASPSHHITSIASSPQTPASRSSSHASQTLSCRRELTRDVLLRLSRGLLWDTQAKSEVLMETLGYIHRAISQHLLANRTAAPADPPTSDPQHPTADAGTSDGPATATGTSASAAGLSGSTSGPPSKSPQASSAPATRASLSPNTPPSASSPLSPAGPTLHSPGDSLEDDGSVQQRRSSPVAPTVFSSQPSSQCSPLLADTKDNPANSATTPTTTTTTSATNDHPQPEWNPGPDSSRTKSLSPRPAARPPPLPRSVSANASPQCEVPGSNPRASTRSVSESGTKPSPALATAASSFDRTIGLQAERDLLGELAGEPISFSHSKKVLWLDNSTKPNWPENDPRIPISPNRTSLRTAPAMWAESKHRAGLRTPDGGCLPLEWDDLPVDVKFSQSYVTMPLLQHQQEAITQELKKGPDISKVPFPPKGSSVRGLLDCCLGSRHLSQQEKKDYIRQLSDWALLFSVTSHQKTETEELFNAIPAEFQNN